MFYERAVRSVTANTRRDGDELLRPAAEIPVRVTTTPFRFDAADRALVALAADQVQGAAVLLVE